MFRICSHIIFSSCVFFYLLFLYLFIQMYLPCVLGRNLANMPEYEVVKCHSKYHIDWICSYQSHIHFHDRPWWSEVKYCLKIYWVIYSYVIWSIRFYKSIDLDIWVISIIIQVLNLEYTVSNLCQINIVIFYRSILTYRLTIK